MRRLRDGLYVIAPQLFAERRGESWFVTGEEDEVIDGPFPTLEALEAAQRGEVTDDGDRLVSLREAAKSLPVTHQALYSRRRTGGLPAPRTTHVQHGGREVELYSFAELAALFEGKTWHERVTEGSQRSWDRLTPAQRAERAAKIRKGRVR